MIFHAELSTNNPLTHYTYSSYTGDHNVALDCHGIYQLGELMVRMVTALELLNVLPC